jgi:hypothetical protein
MSPPELFSFIHKALLRCFRLSFPRIRRRRFLGSSSLRILKLRDGEQKIFFKAGGEWCYLWTPKTFRRRNR